MESVFQNPLNSSRVIQRNRNLGVVRNAARTPTWYEARPLKLRAAAGVARLSRRRVRSSGEKSRKRLNAQQRTMHAVLQSEKQLLQKCVSAW